MKKNVLIDMRSCIEVDGESEKLEITTRGKMLEKDGSIFITYRETDNLGYDGCAVLIRVDGKEKVTVSRSGDVRSHLIIEKGKRNVCAYATPHGTMMLGISSVNIEVKNKQNGEKELFVSYELDVNLELMSKNELSIKIRECKN